MERQEGRTFDPAAETWGRFADRAAFLAVFLLLDGFFLCATVVFLGAGAVALVAAVGVGLVALAARLGAHVASLPPNRVHFLQATPVHHHAGALPRG